MRTSVFGVALSAALLAAALPPWSLGWLATAALVPWLCTMRTRGVLAHAGCGLALGTLVGVAMGAWIYAGVRSLGGNCVEGVAALAFCSVLVVGVPWTAIGAAAGCTRRIASGWSSVVFAFAAAGIEWMWSQPEVGLPWGTLGHTQASVPGVAQLALLGTAALSGLVAGLNHALARASAQKSFRDALPWIGAYLAAGVLGLPIAEAVREPVSGPSANLLLLQSQLPAGERWSPASQRTNLSLLGRETLRGLHAASAPVDLVVWPETSLTTALESDAELRTDLVTWMQRLRTPLLLGGVSEAADAGLYRNSALWIEPDGTILDRFDKTRAVPFVEGRSDTRFGNGVAILLTAGRSTRFVEEAEVQRVLLGRFPLSVALCFEVIYPSLVASRSRDDVLAIVNLANDSWYGGVVGEQQLAFASLRAIEQRRHLVRVADGGPSAVLDPFGRAVREMGRGERGSMEILIRAGGVQPRERWAIGAVAVGGCLLGAAASLAVERRSHR
jgi:apolipoprotein N-acyltransferase